MVSCLLQLSFTGSAKVGKLVAAAAARNVGPCTLELVSTVDSYCCASSGCMSRKVCMMLMTCSCPPVVQGGESSIVVWKDVDVYVAVEQSHFAALLSSGTHITASAWPSPVTIARLTRS